MIDPRLVGPRSGGLRGQAVLGQTQRVYREAFQLFSDFTFQKHGVRVSLSLSATEMDAYMEDYIDSLYVFYDGRMQHLATRALLGVFQELSFSYRGQLPNSSRCLRAWKRLHPAQSARPLPRSWVDLIAVTLALRGEGVAGIGILVAYEGYLRVGELLGLRREHVLLPEDAVSDFDLRDGGCGLRLVSTKRGANQFARISDPAVVRYLRGLIRITPPGGLLFPSLTARKLNSLISLSLRVWGLPDDFTMHSLRHGRAAAAFLACVPPDEIRLAGRWSVLFSMEPYLQASLVLTFSLRSASAEVRGLAHLCARLRPFLVELGALVLGAAQ